MVEHYKREGFAGERLIVIPSDLFAPYAEHPLIGRLYPTDAGFFPHAVDHYRKRPRGCDEHILLYCMKGSGMVTHHSEKRMLVRGDVFCIPRNTPHTYHASADDPWSLLWVHFKGSDEILYPLDELRIVKLEQPREQNRLQALFDMLFESLEGSYTEGNFIHASNIVGAILSEIYCKEKLHEGDERNHYFSKAVRYMHSHVHGNPTLEDVARYLMVSKSYLHALFRQYANKAPMEYFQHLKIEMACRYLDMTDLQIQEIAERLGYSDIGYFSRRFKLLKQQSPSAYRISLNLCTFDCI
jgi:AraC-like DNA-binding protein